MAFVQGDTESVSRPFNIFFDSYCLTQAFLLHLHLCFSVSLALLLVFLVCQRKTIDWIDSVPLFMDYVSLRFESEMSETCIVVGLSSNHRYFLCVCSCVYLL